MFHSPEPGGKSGHHHGPDETGGAGTGTAGDSEEIT